MPQLKALMLTNTFYGAITVQHNQHPKRRMVTGKRTDSLHELAIARRQGKER